MAETLLGSKIGHFRIVDLLAKGGMGEVYVGYDETLQRKVALKGIRPEYRLHDEARARFLREARILSQLGHPNICQIYDYIEGEQSDFLVLELISGKSLTQVIKKGLDYDLKMSIAEQVAAVLVAAHDKGVIHRDLKPDNVMLAEADQVKVLDFGLSGQLTEEVTKSLLTLSSMGKPELGSQDNQDEHHAPTEDRAEVPGSSGHLTTAGTILGTLGYMSPEQARCEMVTPASDMYSFGLLLQELFTGKAVHEPGLAAPELLEMARKGETLPVAGIDPDLGALIGRLKSLSPAARPSATDTAEKLAWIRSKPLRRRKKILGWSGVAALVVFGAAMTFQSIRATRAERRAQRELEAANHVTDFLEEMFKLYEPWEAKRGNVTARELLDAGSVKVKQDLKTEPALQARLMGTIGNLYDSLGLDSQAEPLAKEALEIQERISKDDTPDLASSLNRLAKVYDGQQRYAEAEPLYRRALAIREKAWGVNHIETAHSLSNLAGLLAEEGKNQEAEALYLRSKTTLEKTAGADSRDVAGICLNLAFFYCDQGKYLQAEDLAKRAQAIIEKADGPDSVLAAESSLVLSMVYGGQGKYEQAEIACRRSMAIYEKTMGPDFYKVAETNCALSRMYFARKEWGKAAEPLQRALASYEKTQGPDSLRVAQILCGLGDAYYFQGHYLQAEPIYERALGIYEKSQMPDNQRVPSILLVLASIDTLTGQDAKAEPFYKRSLDMLERTLGPEHVDVGVSLGELADFYLHQHNSAKAAPLLQRTLAIYEKVLEPDKLKLIPYLRNMAFMYAQQKEYGKAEELLQRCMATLDKSPASEHPAAETCLYSLGCYRARNGDRVKALDYLQQAVNHGYSNPLIGSNSDLLSLHGTPEFERLVAEVKQRAEAKAGEAKKATP